MLKKFKESSFKAKMGYITVVVAVILGVSNVGDKVWSNVMKVDARYAKQVDLNDTNMRVTNLERDYNFDRYLQKDQQLQDMFVKWGADMSKWTDAQRQLYYKIKAERDALKQKLGIKD